VSEPPATARPGPVLLVSATSFEVEPLLRQAEIVVDATAGGWPDLRRGRLGGAEVVFLATGLGKANAAAAIAAAAAALASRPAPAAPPRLVLQVGIGGAYPGSGLSLGAAAIAASEFDLDLGVGSGEEWRGLEALGFPLLAGGPPIYNLIPVSLEPSRRAAAAAAAALVPFATSDRVTAGPREAGRIARRHGVAVESMEGAATAQVCLALGLPFVEIRGISNAVGQRDKAAWDVPGAVTAACLAAAAALAVL